MFHRASSNRPTTGVARRTGAVSAVGLAAAASVAVIVAAAPLHGAAATKTVGSVTTSGITKARCEANRKAGKITYLTGFDHAAAASIVEMNLAESKGYFKQMCLTVEIKPSFSTANYGLVAAGQAQFASSGSYTELVRNTPAGRRLVMVYGLGHTAIDTLMVRDDGKITALSDLKGKTIGVKGALPASIAVMLSEAGLKAGTDYKTVPVEGFNPIAHFQLPIDALPGWKSNEPGALDRAGVKIRQFDPTVAKVPGSFGVVYTSADFLSKHPTAAQDFVRASLKATADAIANPAAAVTVAFKKITAGGNRNFLSAEGEGFRWPTEAKLITSTTPAGVGVGVVVPAELQRQVDAYAAADFFPSGAPAIAGTYDATLASGVYDSRRAVIWPVKK